jgi:Protein of unknown function (DUF2946)
MLSKKLFRWVHKIALFAIIFASFAPSISHALAAQNGVNSSFAQEICTSNGKKISINVQTTKGQQFSVEFAVKQSPQPKSMAMHLEHCPFCASPVFAADLPNNQLSIIGLLEVTAQKTALYAVPFYVNYTHKTPPAQAPPSYI